MPKIKMRPRYRPISSIQDHGQKEHRQRANTGCPCPETIQNRFPEKWFTVRMIGSERINQTLQERLHRPSTKSSRLQNVRTSHLYEISSCQEVSRKLLLGPTRNDDNTDKYAQKRICHTFPSADCMEPRERERVCHRNKPKSVVCLQYPTQHDRSHSLWRARRSHLP